MDALTLFIAMQLAGPIDREINVSISSETSWLIDEFASGLGVKRFPCHFELLADGCGEVVHYRDALVCPLSDFYLGGDR
jgi:hypothetical protein